MSQPILKMPMYSTALKLRELTLIKGRRDRALHPGSVVIHHVDGEVRVPVRNDLHRTVALCAL